MADGWEKIRKQVTCSICLCVFQEPKILPCLHTYCAKCLQKLWEQTRHQADRPVGNSKVLYCPTCREKVSLSAVEKLPLNFFVSHLVDIVEMQDKVVNEAPPTCQSCDGGENAVASCVPCGVFMCSSCLGVHKKLNVTRSHQVIGLDDIKSGKVAIPSILDHKQEMCSIHPDKPLELYCKEDKSLICLGCAVVKHRDHQYDFISEVAREQKKEISSTLPEFRAQVINIKLAAIDVQCMQEKLQKRHEENIHVVEQTFQEITMALNARKQQLLEDFNKTTTNRMKALKEQHKELLNLFTQMNNYLELVESKLKSERDRAIVTMKDHVVNRGSSLLKIALSKKSSPVETVPPRVDFPRLKKVTDLVNILGISFCNATCTFVEVTNNPSKPTFQVTVKDSSGQPVLNCLSFLDVKIFPESNSYVMYHTLKPYVEQPEIINKGNGRYEFSTTCDMEPYINYRDAYGRLRQRMAQKRHGMVTVQVFGKDVPKSPME